MKNCAYCLMLFALLLPGSLIAQTDTVEVASDWGVGEGSLNTAIQAKIDAGTLSNTVFRLQSFGYYILTSTITVPAGKRLTIVAPTPGMTQETAPPMICWTPSSGVNTTFNFSCYGDIYMKNVWILYATTNQDGVGTQVGSALQIQEDTTDHVNIGVFENVMFDYAPISNGGGSVNIAATHARLTFKNCYWRNNTDTHFRYYGRGLSFPFGTQGWHCDTASFENCTFANLGYVIMQEGGEYYDYVKFNHCTFLNTIMYTLEFGWWGWLSVTNCVYVNAFMLGYSGTGTPDGGAINIDSTSTFGFTVPFTDATRHILFANNSYFIEKWLREYMAPHDPVTNPGGGNAYSDTVSVNGVPHPQPIMSEKTRAFFSNKTAFPYITLGTIYDSTDPGFLIPPTNKIGIKSFLLRKWTDNSDTTWAFDPHSDITQLWPMNEILRYSNSTLKTAGMGGFPLGDLYHWWNNVPTTYSGWKAQSATENQTITNWLTNGISGVGPVAGLPQKFELSQNYPNPFNPTTEIRYSVPQRSVVSLKVYSILGQEVATLYKGERQAGTYSATFDGSRLSSGVYFYQLKGSNVSITKKLVLMK